MRRTTPGGEHPSHVLVVVGEAVNRRILSSALASDGVQVSAAATGREAFQALLRSTFDVVLLDILMPKPGGLELLTYLKGDEHLRHVPVVMLSALEDVDRLVRCIELGAEEYLTKPFHPALLRARVQSCIARKRLHDLEDERPDLHPTAP